MTNNPTKEIDMDNNRYYEHKYRTKDGNDLVWIVKLPTKDENEKVAALMDEVFDNFDLP